MTTNKIFLGILFSFVLASSALAESEKECFEKVSRGIFSFNQDFDRIILEPVAKQYNKLPEKIKTGTGNFTSNIATLLSIPNFVLQGEFKQASDATFSFAINSTVGILGFGNPARALGFEVQKEDLGQTLGTYGVKGGCYFVLPILGPTTARDAIGMIGDTFIDPFATATWREKEFLSVSGSRPDYIAVKAAGAVDFRGDNVVNFDSLEKNSIDLYASQKSLFLQNRESKIKNTQDSDSDDWGNLDK